MTQVAIKNETTNEIKVVEINEAYIQEMQKYARIIEEATKEYDKMKEFVKADMNGQETKTYGSYRVDNKQVKSIRFDSDKFKKDHEDMYNEYKTKEVVQTRFSIK